MVWRALVFVAQFVALTLGLAGVIVGLLMVTMP